MGPLDLRGQPRCMLRVVAVLYVGFSQVPKLRASTALKDATKVNAAGHMSFTFSERLALRGAELVPGATLVLELHRQRIKEAPGPPHPVGDAETIAWASVTLLQVRIALTLGLLSQSPLWQC